MWIAGRKNLQQPEAGRLGLAIEILPIRFAADVEHRGSGNRVERLDSSTIEDRDGAEFGNVEIPVLLLFWSHLPKSIKPKNSNDCPRKDFLEHCGGSDTSLNGNCTFLTCEPDDADPEVDQHP